VRERLSSNVAAWTDAIHRCLKDAGHLARDLESTRAGRVRLTALRARNAGAHLPRYGSFDLAVRQLRAYFETCGAGAAQVGPGARTCTK